MAKDALGNDIKASSWLATHQAGDRSLSQGLKVRPGLKHADAGHAGLYTYAAAAPHTAKQQRQAGRQRCCRAGSGTF